MIHEYYLQKCKEAVKGIDKPVIIKTDLWNETRPDIEGTGDIIGQFPESKRIAIEIHGKRCIDAKVMFGDEVNILNADMRWIQLSGADVIFCLGTINFIPFRDVPYMVQRFWNWLNENGRMYISVWTTQSKSKEVGEDWKPNHHAGERFEHNTAEWEAVLTKYFEIKEREQINNSLIGYQCIKKEKQ